MVALTTYNIIITLFVASGGFSYGYGAGSFPTSIGQPGFYAYYKLDPESLYTANILSACNALFFGGCAIGAIAQSILADRYGRKKAMAVGGLLALIGAALVAGAVNVPMLIVVRILQGGGLGMLLALLPLYLTEVSPPRSRGILTGCSTLSFGFGYVVCSWLSLGCYHAKDLTLSWRLPLALACVGPLVLLAGLYFVPESPRYLVWKNQLEEAWKVLRRLHYDPSQGSEDVAFAEYTQIVRQVEADREDNLSFLKMFQKPSWRKRSLLTLFLLFAGQATGVYGITNFLPIIFKSLNMTGDLPLIMYAAHTTTGTVFVLISILIVDRFGRRTLFLVGFGGLACILLAEALLQMKYLGTDSKGGNAACVVFIFLFIAFFQCVDAPAIVWATEIFPTQLRAKGASLALFAFFTGAITFSTPAPVAFKNIEWRMFLIYFALVVIAFCITYCYVAETKGLPVEEIGALFGDNVAVHMREDGEGLVETDDKIEKGMSVTIVERL